MKPKFSVVVIAKNEEASLPGMFESLKEFLAEGGDMVVLDTGSSDQTARLAKDMGARVWESFRFLKEIPEEQAVRINSKLLASPPDEPIVAAGDKYFDFASARNFAATLAENDLILALDADDRPTRLDIGWVNQQASVGKARVHVQYIVSRNAAGAVANSFYQSKCYDRRKFYYKGTVHEALAGEGESLVAPEDRLLIEHGRPVGGHAQYLPGLAVDAITDPKSERVAHYFSRELMYCGRHRSAIRGFERHIAMGTWKTEVAQSWILMGDCYGALKQADRQIDCYHRAFTTDSNRAESLMRLARLHKSNGNHRAALCYARAALEIPWTGLYWSDNTADYTTGPNEILYWAYGWLGDSESARRHILKCLEYDPENDRYIHDLRYYFRWAKIRSERAGKLMQKVAAAAK